MREVGQAIVLRLGPAPRVARRTWRLLISSYFLMLAIILAATLPVLISTRTTLNRLQTEFDPATSASSGLLVAALNEETGVRGFSLTGQQAYLQPYSLGTSQYASAIATLDGVDLGGPYEKDLAATKAAFGSWKTVAEEILQSVRTIGPGLKAQSLEQQSGKRLFDTFRARQSALATTISDAADGNSRSLHNKVLISIVLAPVALGLGCLLGLGMIIWWRRFGRRADLAQQLLQERTRLAQAAIDVTTDGVFVKDQLGRHILANRARVMSLTDGKGTDVIGRTVDEFLDPGVASKVKESESEVLWTGESRQLEELLVINGRPRTFAVTKNPLTDPDGTIVGIVGVARDVTDELARSSEIERLYGVERDIAHRLQKAMLGNDKVDDARIDVSAYYRPASTETSIGGDWYDVLALTGGAVGLVIGDVVGHGIDAIAAMGQLRSALSALALLDRSPSQTLQALETFASSVPEAVCATVLYARVDIEKGTLEYSSAGHMPIVLLGADGQARILDSTQDPPLATKEHHQRRSTSIPIRSGSIMVLFTDGLVERPGEIIDEGFSRLVKSLKQNSRLRPDELCVALIEDLVQPGNRRDDVAVLVAKFV